MKQSVELRLLTAKKDVLKTNLHRAVKNNKPTEVVYGFERELKTCTTTIRKIKKWKMN